jgi:hypothetical protein
MDWGIVAAGVLAFLFSLFGFYTATVSIAGFKQSESVSAWHAIFGGGFFGWIAMVLALLGSVVLALSVLSPSAISSIPVPPRLLTLYLFSAGFIAELLAIFIHPTFASGPGFKFGHGFAFWISLIIIGAGAALSFLRLKATGGSLPWDKPNTV